MNPNDSSKVPLELAEQWEASRSRLRHYVEKRLDPALLAVVDADDVLGDAFLDALRRWGQFDPKQWPSTHSWFFGIVRDRLIETWRFHTRAVRDPRAVVPMPPQSAEQLAQDIIASGTSPLKAAVKKENKARLIDAINQLPDVDHELLILRFFAGLSFAEVAAILGISVNNANVRHLRALRKLREIWVSAHGAWSGSG